MLFRPLAELCITAAVCHIIDAKEARDISKSGHPDMVMLTQLDGGGMTGGAVAGGAVAGCDAILTKMANMKVRSSGGVAGEYVGETNAAGQREGRGKLVWADGDVYEGEWKAGKKEGRGIYRCADGDVYEGEWKAGEKEGRGIFRFASGNVYEGEWKAGEKEGQGTYLYASGNIEVGFFKANTDVGEGVQWTADGRRARQLQDGEVVKTISLEEAERRVERLGLPMPVRREGKWTAGQRATAPGWFGLLFA